MIKRKENIAGKVKGGKKAQSKKMNYRVTFTPRLDTILVSVTLPKGDLRKSRDRERDEKEHSRRSRVNNRKKKKRDSEMRGGVMRSCYECRRDVFHGTGIGRSR